MTECIRFQKWLEQIGVTVRTGRRWEREGKIKTFYIYSRKYVSFEEIERWKREGTGHYKPVGCIVSHLKKQAEKKARQPVLNS